MCRTIEIDLLQSIGDEAPPPITPDKHGILW
jgi:putative membrane protein